MLSILIPTYNRADFLIKNLIILFDIINKGGFINDINIIISNNCSTDNTREELQKLYPDNSKYVTIYHQEKNIGLQANALFTLSKSTEKYIMYLGDDDYVDYEYLSECMRIIKNDFNTTVIIPNYIPVSVDGKIVSTSRQLIGPTLIFKAGFKSILENSWKGHQLSGLLLRRENLLENYIKYNVNNIYLFIFLVGYSGLKGNTYLVTQNPVKVTQPIQKKDWGYGDDGLINEIFDNYKKLPITYYQRFQLEFNFLYQQHWRLLMYRQLGIMPFLKALRKIAFSHNATLLFTLSIPFLLFLIKLKVIVK